MNGKKGIFRIANTLKIVLSIVLFDIILLTNSAHAIVCEAGYYKVSDDACKMCPANCYCPTDGDKEVVGSTVSCSSETGIQTVSGVEISNGSYDINLCPSEYPYSEAGSTGVSSCYLTTTAGTYVRYQKGRLVACIAGNYCPGNIRVDYRSTGGMIKCPAGTYSHGRASSCTPCPAGTFASNPGSTECTSCPSLTDGYVYDSATGLKSAAQCKEYKDAGANGLTNCSSGRLVKIASSATEWNSAQIEGLSAKPGYKIKVDGDDSDNISCVECGKGYYSAGTNITNCSKCPKPAGSYANVDLWSEITTDSTTSTSVTECYQTKTPDNCLSGTIKRNIENVVNGPGIEWSDPVVSTKLIAQEGYVVDGTQCLPCPDAPEGWTKYYNTNYATKVTNQASSLNGQTTKKSTTYGGISWDYCGIKKRFDGCEGFISRKADNSTKYNEHINSTNLTATAGYYKDLNTAECKQCDPGTYSASGATQCTQCNGGKGPTDVGHTRCVECTQEEYIDSTEKTCKQCPKKDEVNRLFYKFYKVPDKEGKLTCGVKLKISGDGDDYDDAYKGKYSSCGEKTEVTYEYSPMSYYKLVKVSVVSGSRSISKNSTELDLNTDACVPCAENEFVLNNRCTACTAGNYMENNQCKPCSAGYYCPLEDGKVIGPEQMKSYMCPKNYYSTEGARQCEACPTGYITQDPDDSNLNDGPENCSLAPFIISFSVDQPYEYPMLKGERLNSSVITVITSSKPKNDGNIQTIGTPVFNDSFISSIRDKKKKE